MKKSSQHQHEASETVRQLNHHGMSYDACAEALGISAVRVRDIEQRALKKLRTAFAKLGLETLT